MGNTHIASNRGNSQTSVYRGKASGSCKRFGRYQGLFLLITCSLLFTLVFMAVDQYSPQSRFGKNEGAANYRKTYNHGANRGPHIGQKPHDSFENSKSRSRKILEGFDVNTSQNDGGNAPTSFQ